MSLWHPNLRTLKCQAVATDANGTWNVKLWSVARDTWRIALWVFGKDVSRC